MRYFIAHMSFLNKVPSSRNEAIHRIVHIFRIFQRLNKFVTEDMHSELSIIESLLLYELDGDASRSVTELAEHMELDKATISRTLRSLADRKILRLGKDPGDARRITIEITAKGYKILEVNDHESNTLLSWYLRFVTPQEQEKICNYFSRLAAAFGTPPSPPRRNDHPIRSEMRRLAKSLGYLKDNFMGTTYSPAEWQVLASIHLSPLPIPPAFLAHLLWTPASYMSRMLSSLVKKGLVRRPRSSEDSRMRDLYLTEKGKEVVRQIEKAAEEVFGRSLESFSDEEVIEFAKIFAIFVREPEDGIRLVSRDRYIRLMLTDEDKSAARGFLMRMAVDASLEREMPSDLCNAHQVAIGLFEGETLIGVLLGQLLKDAIRTVAWLTQKNVTQEIRDLWIEETAALIIDHIRGYLGEVHIDSSSYVGKAA